MEHITVRKAIRKLLYGVLREGSPSFLKTVPLSAFWPCLGHEEVSFRIFLIFFFNDMLKFNVALRPQKP